MSWWLQGFQKYAVFHGRARRREYWMFTLFNTLIGIGLGIVDAETGMVDKTGRHGVLSSLYSLLIFLPALAVGVRRLHDTDRSGWWFLIAIVPIVAANVLMGMQVLEGAMLCVFAALAALIVLFVFMVLDGTPGKNQYGPNPKRRVDFDAWDKPDALRYDDEIL